MSRIRSFCSAFSSILFLLLLLPTLIAVASLYFYPALQGCSFPLTSSGSESIIANGNGHLTLRPNVPAPFRLLALGDPQLEGDSSLPDPNAPAFPSLRRFKKNEFQWRNVSRLARDVVLKDVPRLFQGYRKRLDLWGNDYYLAHIYRLMRWWTQPTHTVVLGDLLGSQWIDNEEFEERARRFWGRAFAGGVKVPDEVMDEKGRTEILGSDDAWVDTIMAVPGNHDIGYAGDINEERVVRFERVFGKMNWDISFALGSPESAPSLHLVLLNSMNIDSPAFSASLQNTTHDFLSRQLTNPSSPTNQATVLLTHIPLHKAPGICVDSTFFDYFPSWNGYGIKEQNHLSEEASANILNMLLSTETERSEPNERNDASFDRSTPSRIRPKAIILNGHDHEGCDTYHYLSRDADNTADSWAALPYPDSDPVRGLASQLGLREVTVRSMMGQFGGNAGLLSAWWEPAVLEGYLDGVYVDGVAEHGEWKFEYASCGLGVQHWWWGTHVLAVVEVVLGLVWVVTRTVEAVFSATRAGGKKRQVGKGKEKKG